MPWYNTIMSVDPAVSEHMRQLVRRRNRKYGKKWRVAHARKMVEAREKKRKSAFTS